MFAVFRVCCPDIPLKGIQAYTEKFYYSIDTNSVDQDNMSKIMAYYYIENKKYGISFNPDIAVHIDPAKRWSVSNLLLKKL